MNSNSEVIMVLGGQFGSEGKGKITSYLCRKKDVDIAVRCGGPNAGHTVYIEGEKFVLRSLPSGVVNKKTRLLLSAGSCIDLDILFREIEMFDLTEERVGIDYNAVIIDENCVEIEKKINLGERVGSTLSGTGGAVVRRILQDSDLKLAKNIPELKNYLTYVPKEIMKSYSKGGKIIIEGTQGFGLSVYHSPYYPYTTSRDTTASGFLSEVGISPLIVSDIIMVIRTFPIRVGGNSGPLPNEIDWETIQKESGYPYDVKEYTSVTKRLRRVGRFDISLVKKAVEVNMPTEIALTGVDYLDYRNRGVKEFSDLTEETKKFIKNLEKELETPIKYIGTGPLDEELIDLTELK
jgi:adenylosuccinate synthase